MKILISSGGTKVPIDGVRFITNMSSGTFGSKIATEILKLGHEVRFFKAKDSKSPYQFTVDMRKQANENVVAYLAPYRELMKFKDSYEEYVYQTFDEYQVQLERLVAFEQPDVIVLAAAVSDYGTENFVDGKIRSKDNLTINLKPLPKIISMVKTWAPKAKLVGFKLLVNSTEDELLDAAKDSVDKNGCDLVIANDLQDIKNNEHKVYMVESVNQRGTRIINMIKSDPKDPNFLARKVAQKIVEFTLSPV